MSFSAISLRTNGQTIDQTWFNLLRTAGVDLETKYAAATAGLCIPFEVLGPYADIGVANAYDYFLVQQAITLTGCTLMLHQAGVSGTTEIDIQYKRGAGAFASVFTTKPKVDHGNGDFATSDGGAGSDVAGVINSLNSSLQAGDILRLDVTAIPTESNSLIALGFVANLTYTITGG